MVKAINSLPVETIKILAGNHDWLKQGHEYFKFLNHLPNIEFITEPTEDTELSGPSAYFLPYSKNPMKEWAGMDFSHYSYLFMHQTVAGSICSNGQAMEGEELPPLNAGKVFSGDIHVPQIIGNVEYIGSPYHVHFGDAFRPRCVLIERDGNLVDLHFETISRVTVKATSLRELRKQKFKAGDQVKLRVELAESEKHEWSRIRREAMTILQESGVEVHGVELIVKKSERRLLNDVEPVKKFSPGDSVLRFVMDEELGGEALDVAMEVLES